MKHEETAKRLREALEMSGISQRELSVKAKINEASVSQYYNGSHKPSNISAGKMAEVLNVSPMWLMGFDVPMENTKMYSKEKGEMLADLIIDNDLLIVLDKYNELSDKRKELVRSYINMMFDEQNN